MSEQFKKDPSVVVGGLIINIEGKVLLCKSYKWNNLWTIPGGHIEYGESIEEAIKREVKEEVGLDIDLKKILWFNYILNKKYFFKKRHFVALECLCSTNSNKVQIDNNEMQDYNWFEPKDALKEETDPYTHKFIEKYW